MVEIGTTAGTGRRYAQSGGVIPTSVANATPSGSFTHKFAVSDTLQVVTYQSSGGTLNLAGGDQRVGFTMFSIYRLSE